jgi:hypothetical protein
VLSLVQAFFEITLHRRGPESLPASRFLFGLVLVAYAPLFWFSLRAGPVEIAHPVALLVATAALDLAFIWSLLRAFGHERRFMQTATAIFGTDALLNLYSIPPAAWLSAVAPQAATAAASGTATATPQAAIPAVLLLLLTAWSIDISGFVIARAVGRPYVLGVAIMLGYALLTASFRATFFPATPMS